MEENITQATVRWASQHDWFVQAFISQGRLVVEMLNPYRDGLNEYHTDVNELREAAGY